MGKLSKIATLLLIGILIFALAACDGFIPGDDSTVPTDNTEIGEHEHVFTEIIIKEATCTEDGQKDLVCDICGYTESHSIWLGHQYEELPSKAPNCTEAGWDNHQKCSVCGDEFRNDLEIDPNFHIFNAEGNCTLCGKNAYEGIRFSLSSNRNYYTVVGVEDKQINEIWIPAQYEGKAVKAIGEGAFSECQATKIVLPDTITVIENYAFSSCDNLTEIILPEGVTAIRNSAFYNCKSLTTLNIPASVTEIGGAAFRDCANLTSITIPDGVTILDNTTFGGCEKLTTITFGKGVKELGRFVFENCFALANFIVSEENTALKAEDGVLYSKDGTVLYYYTIGNPRTSFTVPNGVKEIGKSAFAYCVNLTSVTLPEDLTHIHEYAFSGCNNLAAINLPETLQYIGDDALAYTALTKVVIPDSVTHVGSWCFLQCKNLTSLTIGTGVTELGGQVVCWCENLTELIFKDPNNWRVEDTHHTQINPDHLRTSASAITTLQVSYCQSHWYKPTEE